MSPALKKLLVPAGYVVFAMVAFVVFVSWTFPYQTLKDRITGTFNAQQKVGTAQQELQIEELTGYWVTGVRANGVRLLSAPTEVGQPPAEIKIDEARARLQILPLLLFNKDIKFSLDLLGGTVDGFFGDHGADRIIELEFHGVEVGKLGPIQQALGIPIEGKLDGTVKLQLPQGKASKGNGTVNLELHELAIGDGKSKIMLQKGMGLPLAKLNVGTVTIEGVAKDGQLKITKISAQGKDLELSGEGRVQLKELANDSVVDVALQMKVADTYKNKNDMTKGLFAALEFSPDGRAAKRADGFYGLRLLGPLGALKPSPNGTGGGGTPATRLPGLP
jgi:type II secretion system protein N